MDHELVVVEGRSASSIVKLGEGVTTIGRHDDCQLRIKSSQVSRKHCEVFEKKGLLLVKDLGSSNGTLVNGQRIQGQRVLEPGDELTIGPIRLRVAKSGATAAAAPSKGAVTPGETAVTEAVHVGDGSDEFTIDFDEPTQAPEPAAVTAPALPTAPPSPPASAPEPKAPPKGKAPAPDEDAIADFLMDINLDDDEQVASTKAAKPAAETKTKTETAPAPPVASPEVKDAPETPSDTSNPPEKEAVVSDDAIADFLLDIKIDEDE